MEDHDDEDYFISLSILWMVIIKILRSDDDLDISDCPNVLRTIDKFTCALFDAKF